MHQLHPRAVWLFLISSLFAVIPAGIFLTLFAAPLADQALFEDANFSGWALTALGFFILLILTAYVWAKLTYHFYKYELREDGFRKEHGIIWKKYVTIPYDRVQNVDIYRGLVARLLGLSDLQIQTAGGISSGSYGAFSEGRLPGLSREVAEQLRDEVIRRARHHRSHQGL